MTESVIQRNHLPVRLTPAVRSSDIQSGRVINASSPISQAMDKQLRRAQMGAGQGVQSQFFSPFRTRPSLETPTKRVDLNEWYRYYFKHDPYVGTAIELHATYPLSGFELEHEDKSLEQMFNEEAEELDLDSLYRRMGMEYWIVGEAFPFGFLDDPEHPQRWERFILLDPDKVKINKHQMAVGKHDRDYFIRLEPDADLKKIVNNGPNHPNTGPLYRNIPVDVIEAVKKGQSIALHPLQASHFKREVNPFNVRGESVISRVIQDLMYLDKLRDAQYAIADRHVCYDKETECLTKDGWKKYDELGWNDLIGTVNKDTGVLEWQRPEGFYINHYKGPMHHFGGSDKDKKIDIMVTPDHRMLVQEFKYQGSSGYRPDLGRSLGNYGYDGEWKVVKSQDVRPKSKFRACVDDFKADHCPDFIEIGDDRYAIDDYLKMAGWYLSEGHWQKISDNAFEVSASQTVGSQHCAEFNELFDKYGFRKSINNQGTVIRTKSGTEFAAHFALHFGVRSWDKKIPVWIRNLPKDKLRILLDAMIAGDGHTATESEHNGKAYQRKYVQYYSVSNQLADDVQEMVFKLGFAPTMHTDPHLKKKSKLIGHTVQWSETSDAGKFPIVGRTKKDVSSQVDYDDVIWCVMVPNTFFVTRRNGKIAVQGNTPKEFYMIGEPGNEADAAELADFHNALMSTYHGYNSAIVWHHALKVQWEGACTDDKTECLTRDGFKTYDKLTYDDQIATFNKDTGQLEYQSPQKIHVYDYDGDLLHFNTNNVDVMVTPNHRMLYLADSDRGREDDLSAWRVDRADEILRHKRLRTKVEWAGSDDYPDLIDIGIGHWAVEDFLKVAGWYVSEGSNGERQCDDQAYIDIAQKRTGQHYDEMHSTLTRIGFTAVSHDTGADIVRFRLTNQELADDMQMMFGKGALNKQVPAMIKELPPRLLRTFLNAAVQGDGSMHKNSEGYATYWTISRRLADDIQEIAFKCGFAPRVSQVTPEAKNGFGKHLQYAVMWSTVSADHHRNTHGSFPNCNVDAVKTQYKGKVWCVTVPNGFFVVRRNGLLNVTGNSGRILPLKPEFDYVEKRLLSGLMMSAAFMHGEGPCCDDQTEVLTEAGWKLMKDVPDGERLAALDKHGNMQYEHFKDRIVKDYDGDMYYFNSKKYDMALTANHWQLFKDRDGEWKTLPVDQMPLDHVQLRCVLDSYKPDNKACDELVSQASELAGKPVSKQWLLRFLGFYTSEGSCILSPSNRSYQIRVSQDRDNECYEELVALMAECPWKVNTYERDQITEWVICNKRFAEWIGGVCGKGSHNKHVPTCLKTATPDDICEFMDFLVFGDGNLRSQGKNKDQQYITYTTISKQLADDVHHLVLLCGFAPIQKQPSPATNNPCWRVHWSLSSDHGKFPWVNGLGRNVVVEHYTGKVYCFEVPSGYIMVRRNGKATVTHNTFANASVALDILIARYMQYREKLEGWSINHVFDPICRMNDIYKPTQAEIAHRIRIRNPVKKPWVPKVRWERGALRDDQFKIGLIKELVEKSFLPRVDLYRAINKDIKQVKQELATQAKDDRELRKNGDPIPGQPQAPAGLPGAPPPPSGGMGGGGGGKPPLPGAGLPPGAPKLPSLPQGTEGAVGAGTGPAMPAIAPGV